MMTATISPTEKSVKATSAKHSTTDGYPDEKGIPTRRGLLETFPLHYRNVETSREVLATPIRSMMKVAAESAGARSG